MGDGVSVLGKDEQDKAMMQKGNNEDEWEKEITWKKGGMRLKKETKYKWKRIRSI